MKIAYIAGPYRAKTINGVFENIMRARRVAAKYFRKGYGFVCPHTNSILLDGIGGQEDAQQWLDMDLELIKRLRPTMVMMKGWQKSKGAVGEHKLAKELGLEIIYDK